MLDPERPQFGPSVAGAEGSSGSAQAGSYADIVAAVRRQWMILAVLFLVGLAGGGAYLSLVRPAFQSTATVLIDTRKYPETPQAQIAARTTYDSSAAIDTQVEILKSSGLINTVVDKLKLWNEPEFIAAGGGLREIVYKYLGFSRSSAKMSEVEARGRAAGYLLRHLNIKRVSDTFTIDVSFESTYADQAAKVANATAEAYIDWQRNLHHTAIASAGEWLEERIKDLKEKSSSGQRSVSEFRAQNNVFDDADGILTNEKHLTELSNQLDAARAQAEDAQWKLGQLTQLNPVRGKEFSDIEMFSALENISNEPSIVALRRQYIDTMSRYEQLSKVLPSGHEALTALRAQIQNYHTTLFSELARVRLMVKNNKESAQDKIKSVQAEISATINESRTVATAQSALKQLEVNAQTYQSLYDSFLRRYAEALEADRSPAAEASIISPAEPPPLRNYKKALLIFAAFPAIAIAIGAVIAFVRENVSRPFWTSREVESKLGTPCADVVPKLDAHDLKRVQSSYGFQRDPSPSRNGPAWVRNANPVSYFAIGAPMSHFAEGIRSIRAALKINGFEGAGRAVGFTSALPNEGKSSVALSVAAVAAKAGVKTILVDCDFRNPAQTMAWLHGESRPGLVDIIVNGAKLEDVVLVDEDTNLHFVPGGISCGRKFAGDMMTHENLVTLIRDLKNRYDLVIVDLSPMSPVIDVAFSSTFVDGYVLVIEWGRTRVNTVNFILRKMPHIHENIITAVLNKADLKSLKKFGFDMQDYYSKKYIGRYITP